jgi:hypothetical protein
MKKKAGSGAAELRSRHKDFFKRLGLFLKNYSEGVCGLNAGSPGGAKSGGAPNGPDDASPKTP